MAVALEVSESGADSQWAETMRIARGFGKELDHAKSWRIHSTSSKSGGAPWLT